MGLNLAAGAREARLADAVRRGCSGYRGEGVTRANSEAGTGTIGDGRGLNGLVLKRRARGQRSTNAIGGSRGGCGLVGGGIAC